MFQAGKMFRLFSRSTKALKIQARWDEDAGVWYVADSDVPGLHAEAETPEALLETLRELVPELVESNFSGRSRKPWARQVPIELITHRKETFSLGG